MGGPTERLNGKPISQYQSKKRESNGHRSYKIKSSQNMGNLVQQRSGGSSGRSGGSSGSISNQKQPFENTPPPKKGVVLKRSKKRLKQLAMKGSPATQMASEETLHDMITGNRSTALDHVLEAQEDSEPDDDNNYSQTIAKEAVHMKKLEKKRKGSK